MYPSLFWPYFLPLFNFPSAFLDFLLFLGPSRQLLPQRVCICSYRPKNAFFQLSVGHSLISLSFFLWCYVFYQKPPQQCNKKHLPNTMLSISLLYFSFFIVVKILTCIYLKMNEQIILTLWCDNPKVTLNVCLHLYFDLFVFLCMTNTYYYLK